MPVVEGPICALSDTVTVQDKDAPIVQQFALKNYDNNQRKCDESTYAGYGNTCDARMSQNHHTVDRGV